MEKDCEQCPGSVGECLDQLAMSAVGKDAGIVKHSSHDYVFPEVSLTAFSETSGQMYQQPGAPDRE